MLTTITNAGRTTTNADFRKLFPLCALTPTYLAVGKNRRLDKVCPANENYGGVALYGKELYMSLNRFKLKKAVVFLVVFALVSVAVYVYILLTIGTSYDPSTEIIDRQIVEKALDDMKSELTEKDYEMMLVISKDWEENTDGKKYLGQANTNLKVENGEMAYIDLHRRGFREPPMSMIIYEDEVGVKYIRDIIEPDTDNPYHEKAEYGICYIYDDDPYKFVDADIFRALVPYYTANINYLEKVYDDLYIYVIYADPLA